MRLFKTRHIIPILLAAILVVATGCSTQKNTARTRWWHSFKARYNTYYNGSLAYIDASLEKEEGNKDNFTELIPLYTVSNKNSREIGKSNYDRAIEKCQKTIKLHSIKRRPQWTKQRKKTAKDLEWLSRREYNPFLWKAWLLMGRSQFYKGAFDEAAATFNYMSRLYQTQPAIYAKSRAWLAKCYIEEGWLYDAEDVIRNMQRDSIHWSARKEWDYTYADYYIHTGEYEKAIPHLRNVIKHEMRRKQRAREWFLMGQMQAALGNNVEAMKAFKHVTKLNPPYELEFNARICMTEVMSVGQSKKMIGRLKRMARSDKNKEYLDQVYYAIGNIYLAQSDTAQAINAYERGAAKATRSGIEKGVLLLKLGDIYWDKERYNDAQRCYGQAIGMLDKERKDYEELSNRSKILDDLVPYTDAIHLQDSLQSLAKMSESDRNAAIDRTIEALKKKEKEERRLQAEQDAQNQMNGGNDMAQNNQFGNNTTMQNQQNQQNQRNAQWYFYNQMAVSQGKAAFQKQWGKRENVDDWQRVNKTVVAFQTDEPELTEEQQDSIAQAEAIADSLALIADSAQNDPHKREYYMAQIPFTEEQVAASNNIIAEGLYNSGVIFKDKLDNLPRSEKQFMRLIGGDYPNFEKKVEAYYHLYLLYMRKGDRQTADSYVARLKQEYPESEWTTLLTDPNFVENARLGVHLEDSLYAATYDAFKAARYKEVRGNVSVSEQRFPLGTNRDKFLFIGGLGKLNDGDYEGCINDLNTVVKKYPQSPIAVMAGMIVKGVNEGRQLQGGKFDLENIWERRSQVLNESDSTAVREFSNDRNAAFIYMIAYQPDSIDANHMLFELARYNFTSFMVRNFDIEVEQADGLNRMLVKGFRNYDEALQYARQLQKQKQLMKLVGKSRQIVISDVNLPLLGKQFSYADYAEFYEKNFAPLKIASEDLLDIPEESVVEPDEQKTTKQRDDFEEEPANNQNTTNTFFEEEPQPTEEPSTEGGVVNIEEEQPQESATETVVEEEPATTVVEAPKPEVKEEPATTVVEEPKPEVKEEPKPVVKEEPKQLEDDFYFGEDPQPQQSTSNKKQNSKQTDSFDDDEYYDLDGF
ncbi:hypothetical protein [Leyella stercorea]|uniref:type IX secretion system periplasmic lipoprotein PorW/SprE n=1 Tax=Leyella stercorea TaxID=363265 RepID=UPI00242D1043